MIKLCQICQKENAYNLSRFMLLSVKIPDKNLVFGTPVCLKCYEEFTKTKERKPHATP